MNSFLFIIALAITISRCSKGQVGPAGATGATGATGSTGATDSANVIYSSWDTIKTWSSVSSKLYKINLDFNQPAPLITQRVLDSSVIITYINLLGCYSSSYWPIGQVAQLPIIGIYRFDSNADHDNLLTWQSFATLGNIRINFIATDNNYTTVNSLNGAFFRYIIIPGAIATNRVANPVDYSKMTYEQICTKFNIPK